MSMSFLLASNYDRLLFLPSPGGTGCGSAHVSPCQTMLRVSRFTVETFQFFIYYVDIPPNIAQLGIYATLTPGSNFGWMCLPHEG